MRKDSLTKLSSQICYASNDFFSQFCHRSKLIVLSKDIKTKCHQRVRDQHLKALKDFLSNSLFITSINLSYNKITSAGLKIVADILVSHPHIKELILSNNNIDGEGIKYLAQKKSEIHLECLRINGNKLMENTEEYITDLLTNNSKLKYLDLGETDMTNDILRKIAPSIIESKITGLVISSIVGFNSKTEDTALIVRHITAKNISLSMLYLRKLQLADSDVEIICAGLQQHPGLKLLDLSGNHISDVGGGFIIKYVVESKKLQGLFLNHNRVSDGTAYSLSTMVPTSRISMLDVSYNSITDEGLLYLLDILQARTKLRILLWGNSIGPKCRVKLKTLHKLGNVLPDRIDLVVAVQPSDQVEFDHNAELDMFRVHYYSLNSKRVIEAEPSCYTFPFHTINLE